MTPPVVEVVARYQGRVVDVQHIRWAEPPAVGPSGLIGAGALLCGVGLVLALRGSGVGLALLASGLVALALAHLRWRDRPNTRYVIGEAAAVDLTVSLAPGAQRDAFPLVVALSRGAVLGIPPGATGRIEAERPIDLAEAAAQGRRSVALPEGGRARVELGELTFEIHTVEAAAPLRMRWQIDRLTWLSHIGAAAVLGGLFMSLEPGSQGEVKAGEEERFERVARYLTAIERPASPPERASPAPPSPRVVRERRPVAEEVERPKLAPDASPEEIERVETAVARDISRQRGLARHKDGKDSEYDYDRVAGVLGDPDFVKAVDDFTMTGRAGMIAYAVTKEDDAWWAKQTSGPPSMARHFGGLELAKTERGGGVHDEAPKAGPPKPVVLSELERPKPKQLTPQQEARIGRFVKLDIDPPTLEKGSGMEAMTLYTYVRKHVEGLRTCYDDALDRTPELGGVVKLVVRFDAEGEVIKASFAYTTLRIGEIEPCLLKAVRRWRLAPAEPKPTAAVFHLQFSSYRR